MTCYYHITTVSTAQGQPVPVYVGSKFARQNFGSVTGLSTEWPDQPGTGGAPLSSEARKAVYDKLCLSISPRHINPLDFLIYAGRLDKICSGVADRIDDGQEVSTINLATDSHVNYTRRPIPVRLMALRQAVNEGYVGILNGAIAMAPQGEYKTVDQLLEGAGTYAAREGIAEEPDRIKTIRAESYNAAYAKHTKNAKTIIEHLLDDPLNLESLGESMKNFMAESAHIEEVERRAKANGIELDDIAKTKALVAELNREVERLWVAYGENAVAITDDISRVAETWVSNVNSVLSKIFGGTRPRRGR